MSEAHGAELARYSGTHAAMRQLARVRGVCGGLGLVASILTLLGDLPVPAFLIALLGLLISLAWLRQARKLSRAARHAEPPTLVIHERGVLLRDHAGARFLAFTDVTAFELDEERVDVRVLRHDGEALHIEPQYEGVDLSVLVRTLGDALRASRATSVHGTSER